MEGASTAWLWKPPAWPWHQSLKTYSIVSVRRVFHFGWIFTCKSANFSWIWTEYFRSWICGSILICVFLSRIGRLNLWINSQYVPNKIFSSLRQVTSSNILLGPFTHKEIGHIINTALAGVGWGLYDRICKANFLEEWELYKYGELLISVLCSQMTWRFVC